MAVNWKDIIQLHIVHSAHISEFGAACCTCRADRQGKERADFISFINKAESFDFILPEKKKEEEEIIWFFNIWWVDEAWLSLSVWALVHSIFSFSHPIAVLHYLLFNSHHSFLECSSLIPPSISEKSGVM